ncbi:serine/threonine-protein kinase [Streptomyces sp. ACA25]|uniref:serine/threonine-protein kinase n=1 Tax=Streptomyces sp. ACA25 TaxID=3022596 RepID=UPI00230803F8|nr:serine/threonine-protein kinase [Streptomyces sp. ACA25]MDB1090010.1 serine/threonine-protein kinase [Streptomyces sp. ACA25]
MHNEDGIQLPGYEILETLGQGGFATVHRARQLSVGREVALKLDSRVLATARDQQRFLREVTAAGQLSGHPHVVAVYDAGVRAGGRPYMVLELCPGGSLADRLRREGPLPVKEVRDIGVGIADALAAAHTAGVLHRDVKPGNIMLNRYGGVALADFGLAAMPRPGQELSVTREALTPAYAPPEAFRMAEPTPAGDVYSLAATLYALLCGYPPRFPEDGSELSLAELIVRHTWPVPELAAVPGALNEVLRQALETDPGHRLSDAGVFRDALAAVDPAATGPGGFGPVPAVGPPARGDIPPSPYGPGSVLPPAERDWPPGTPAQRPGGGGPGTTGAAAPERRDRRGPRTRLVAVLAAVSLTVGVGVTVLVNQFQPWGDGTSAAPSTPGLPEEVAVEEEAPVEDSEAPVAPGLGVPITTDDCPAAAVQGVDGACVTTPECWGGMVIISGIVSVTAADCRVSHVWETFAIAPLPQDGDTHDYKELSRHPDVLELCSAQVMAASRNQEGQDISAGSWEADVLPPTERQYADGLRAFRCVAAATGTQDGYVTGIHFGPGG